MYCFSKKVFGVRLDVNELLIQLLSHKLGIYDVMLMLEVNCSINLRFFSSLLSLQLSLMMMNTIDYYSFQHLRFKN